MRVSVGGRLWSLGGVIVAMHIAALVTLALSHAGGAALVGLGMLAYLFGLRHAFDVDHIAAIDNVTRKLRNDGKRPVFAGFLFSLGHSSVVIALSLVLVFTLRHTRTDMAALSVWGGFIGTAISAIFLTLIGVVNALVLIQLLRIRRCLQGGHAQDADALQLEELLNKRGLIARALRSFYRHLDASWKMYPLGLLFGLGFDTATEIAILGLSAVAAQNAHLPLWAVMAFPLLFTAGMTLMDSLDGLVMLRAYDWAMSDMVHKVSFNVVVTGLSVATALIIGALEWGQLLGRALGAQGPVWTALASLDFGALGLSVTILMVTAWTVALIHHRRTAPAR